MTDSRLIISSRVRQIVKRLTAIERHVHCVDGHSDDDETLAVNELINISIKLRKLMKDHEILIEE